LAVVLSSLSMLGFLNSYTSPAFTNNPAQCSSQYPGACDAALAAALDAFPYWNYRADQNPANATNLILGTANGYVWGITCQHCASNQATTWTLAGGPDAGRVFNSVGHPSTPQSAYRQFGNGSLAPVFQQLPGDLIFRLSPQTGSMPSLPFVRILPSRDMLKDDTLILSIGHGVTATHSSRGWYKECATTQAGGMPASGRPSCCLNERIAGNYGPLTGASGPRLPVGTLFGTNSPVAWGGEGDVLACSTANPPLTYLGAVWTESGWHWGTSHLYKDNAFTMAGYSSPYWTGTYLQYGFFGDLFSPTRIAGKSVLEKGLCVTTIPGPTGYSPGSYFSRLAPTNREKSQIECQGRFVGVDEEDGSWVWADLDNAVNQGDSGSVDFAYVNGVWYLMASGAGPVTGTPFGLPETYRAEAASWMYPTTADDQDQDGIHNLSDNCAAVANGNPNAAPFNQIDSDGDRIGNICDGDFDQDQIVAGTDWITFLACFGRPVGQPGGPAADPTCEESDLTGDHIVAGTDYSAFLPMFGQPLGPSGPACLGMSGPCVP